MSAFSVDPLSTGLVPERSLEPAPSAESGKSATVFVPPLSFTTTLRRCSFGAMSSFVIVQVADWPAASVIELPFCVPPLHTNALAA